MKEYNIFLVNNQLLFGGSLPDQANIIISNPTTKLIDIVEELTTATPHTITEFCDSVDNKMLKAIGVYILDRKIVNKYS